MRSGAGERTEKKLEKEKGEKYEWLFRMRGMGADKMKMPVVTSDDATERTLWHVREDVVESNETSD
jgi:hypothetical protein